MPPPMMPSRGRPKWPKINAQLSRAFKGIPAVLITSTQPGRSIAAAKLRMHWNSIHDGMTHI